MNKDQKETVRKLINRKLWRRHTSLNSMTNEIAGLLDTLVESIPEQRVYDPYVTFTAQEDNSSIGLKQLSVNQILEYSTDTTTWNTFDTTTNISLNNGDKVYVRGILNADNISNNYTHRTNFKMSGKIAAFGNCNAIWNYEDLNAPLKNSCGHYMFCGCTSLTTPPELPATTLTENCYMQMFYGCTSLTTAPELPATTLAKECYYGIFWGCTSLTTVQAILPATTLATSCYYGMFSNCTSLTTAPELPATTLATDCYRGMFQSCKKLNYIKCLAIDQTASNCTSTWIISVPSTGTFIKHPDATWSTGYNGIPSGWTVVDAEL